VGATALATLVRAPVVGDTAVMELTLTPSAPLLGCGLKLMPDQ
jgi:hypothetical protein